MIRNTLKFIGFSLLTAAFLLLFVCQQNLAREASYKQGFKEGVQGGYEFGLTECESNVLPLEGVTT